MPVTIASVAALLPDRKLDLLGDTKSEAEIRRPATLTDSDAQCLVWARDAARLASVAALLAIVPEGSSLPADARVGAVLHSPAPRLDFARVLAALFAPAHSSGVHESATIDPDAKIASSAYVGPGAVIGEAVVGERSVIHSGVHLYDGTRIGADVIVHSGTVIGSDGFGYERDEQGVPVKLPHLGGVLVHDRVEIGSNTSIDRGTLGDTVLHQDAKIDNLVHIAHNVEIGPRTMIAAGAMVAGSCRLGADVWVGPQAAISDGLQVGDGASVTLGSVVTRNVTEGGRVTGNFAVEHSAFIRNLKRAAREE